MAKEIKAFELTEEEIAVIKARVKADKTEGGVKEAQNKAAVAKAAEFLKDMKLLGAIECDFHKLLLLNFCELLEKFNILFTNLLIFFLLLSIILIHIFVISYSINYLIS